MTMGISSRDKKILLCVAGAAVVLLVFFLVFRPTREKTKVLKEENAQLATRVEELTILDQNKEEYLAETAHMNSEIVEKLSHFPVAVKEEDSIMYAVQLEKYNDMVINAISINPEELLYTSSIPTSSPAVKSAPEGVDVTPLYLYNTNSVYSFTSSYEGFKENLAIIQKDADTKNVNALSLAYDSESGMLIGTMSVNMFAVDGTGEEYKEPGIRNMKTGVANVFGTAAPVDVPEDGEDEGDSEE